MTRGTYPSYSQDYSHILLHPEGTLVIALAPRLGGFLYSTKQNMLDCTGYLIGKDFRIKTFEIQAFLIM